MGEHLGSGFQGSVYRVNRKVDGKPLVVKVLTANEEHLQNMAHNEIALLRKIEGQKHLAQIVDCFEDLAT